MSSVVAVASGAMIRLPLLSHGFSERDDVTEVGDSGPSFREDGAGVGVDLREADGGKSCSLQTEIESADAREEAGVCSVAIHATGHSNGASRGLGSRLRRNQARRRRRRLIP